jgi:hypothetical protein
MTDINDQAPIDWAAIIAGAVLATALGVILLGFGGALGLSVTSPFEGEGARPAMFAIGAGLWVLWVQILSFSVGGYAAARLRKRQVGLSQHETDVRDGFHGLLVWGVGVLAAGVIAVFAVGGATATLENPGPASGVVASVARSASAEVDQAAERERVQNPEAADETLAERRAEIARKLAVLSAFITAASLLVGAAAAFYAAESGGRHREKGRHIRFYALTKAEAADAARRAATQKL